MAYAAQGQKPAAFRDAGIQPGPGGGQGLEVDSLAGKGAGGTQQVCELRCIGCKDCSRRKQAVYGQSSHGL
jgi:hypothetical protein